MEIESGIWRTTHLDRVIGRLGPRYLGLQSQRTEFFDGVRTGSLVEGIGGVKSGAG